MWGFLPATFPGIVRAAPQKLAQRIDLYILLGILSPVVLENQAFMSQSYENLRGAAGRERFFRPRRYKATELFSGSPPRLWFDEEEFSLEDISVQGAGCLDRSVDENDAVSGPGATGLLRLTQHGRDLFRAAARKARVTPQRGGAFAGFELTGDHFDLHRLVRDNARALATADNEAFVEPAPQEYKAFCAEAAAFIGEYLQRIDRYIAPIEEGLSADERDDIARSLSEDAEPGWTALLQQGNRLSAENFQNKTQRIAMKSFTERVVTQMLVEGPGWARCYYKPAGYPGDYKIMNYGYERRPEGDTVRQKFLHLLGMIASRAIVSRMETLATLIADYANARGDKGDVRYAISSVGSGPARELEDILKATPAHVGWDVTLIDQEPAALDYVYSRIVDVEGRDRLNLNALNISFRDMLSPSREASSFMNNDIIYSSGLVDYLNPLLAQRFVKRLYDYVKPGGQVIIGNVNELPTGMIWPLEFVTDWSLYFRTEDEMRAIAQNIPDASVSVVSDPMEAIYFLIVEKPL